MVNLGSDVKVTGEVDTEGPVRRLCGEMMILFYIYVKSNNVSCEFDKFRVDTHLCKPRNTPVAVYL